MTDEMQEIIDAYTEALINTKHIVGKASELPYDKSRISEVLLEAYKNAENAEEKEIIEEAYLKLESFLNDEDYDKVSEYLTILSEYNEEDISQEELFEKVTEKVPETALDVIEILGNIEEQLKKRRADLGQ